MAQILRDTDGNPLDKLENSDLGDAVLGTAKDDGSGNPVFSEMKLDRILVDLSGGITTPTEDQKSARGYDGRGNEYVVGTEYRAATDAGGMWNDYSNSNYEGVNSGNPYIRGAIGNFYYNPDWHHWYESFSEAPFVRWGSVSASRALGSSAVWLGELDSDTEASNAISTLDTTKTYYFYHNSERKVKVLDNVTYTAPVGPSQELVWSRVGKDEARRIGRLENQALARHKIEISDFQIDGNASHTVSIDVSAMRAFLSDSRAYGVLRLTLKYQASHAEGSIITNLGPSGSYLINNSLSIGSTAEQSRSYTAVSLSSTSFGSDSIDFEIDINGTTTSGFNILFTDVEIEIINGYLPSQAQLLSLLNMTLTELNNMLVNASIVGNNIIFQQNDGTSISIPRTTATTTVDVGNALPTSGRRVNDLYLFNEAVTGLTNAVDTDGTTAKTTAQAFDLFRLTATSPDYQWTYVGFVGDTTGGGGSDDGVITGASINANNQLVITRSESLPNITVDLDDLFDRIPVRHVHDIPNLTATGNTEVNRTIDLSELREFLALSDRAYAFLRARATVSRTGSGGNFTLRLRDNGLIGGHTQQNLNAGTDYTFTVAEDINDLGTNNLTVQFQANGAGASDTFTVTSITVDVIAGFEDDDEADSYVTGVTRNGTVLTFARNNSLNSLSVDLAALFDNLSLHEIVTAADATINQNSQIARNLNVTKLRRFLGTHPRTFGYLRLSMTYRRNGGGAPAGRIRGEILDGITVLDSFDQSNVPGQTDVPRQLTANIEGLSSNTLELAIETSTTPTGDTWTISDISLDLIAGIESPEQAAQGFITNAAFDPPELSFPRTHSHDDFAVDLSRLSAIPMRATMELADLTISTAVGNVSHASVSVARIRQLIAADARAYGHLTVRYRFQRTDGNEGGGTLRGGVRIGGTEIAFNESAPVSTQWTDVSFDVDPALLTADTIELRFDSDLSGGGSIPTTHWDIENIAVEQHVTFPTVVGDPTDRQAPLYNATNRRLEWGDVITPFAGTRTLEIWDQASTLSNGKVVLTEDTITIADVDAGNNDRSADIIASLLIGRVIQLQHHSFPGGNSDAYSRVRITSARTDITSPVNASRYNIVWLYRDESYWSDGDALDLVLVDHDVNLVDRWIEDEAQGLWNPVLIFDGSVTGTGTGTLGTGFEFNQFRWLVWAYHSTDTNNAGSGSVGVDEQRQKHLTLVSDFLSSKQNNPPSDTTLVAAFGVQLHARTRNCVVQRVWSSGVGSDNQFVITHQGVADGIIINEIYGIY